MSLADRVDGRAGRRAEERHRGMRRRAAPARSVLAFGMVLAGTLLLAVPSGATETQPQGPTTLVNVDSSTTSSELAATSTTSTTTSTSTSTTTSTTSTSTTSTSTTSTSTTTIETPVITPRAVVVDDPAPTTTTTTTTSAPAPATAAAAAVAPETFSLTAATRCTKDAPWVDLHADAPGFSGTYTLHWLDASGAQRLTQQVPLGAASILYPGATISSTGVGTDWPGWIHKPNGKWVVGNDGWLWARQPGVRIFGSTNPTSQPVALNYPTPTRTCHAGPPTAQLLRSAKKLKSAKKAKHAKHANKAKKTKNATLAAARSTLASTGGDAGLPIGIGAALIISGVALMLVERRRIANR
jgi:hypothetical protein